LRLGISDGAILSMLFFIGIEQTLSWRGEDRDAQHRAAPDEPNDV
jgi:hypothetical protein